MYSDGIFGLANWMYSDGGFDLATVKKTPRKDDADYYTITINLGPKQAFGFVLPTEARETDWMDQWSKIEKKVWRTLNYIGEP